MREAHLFYNYPPFWNPPRWCVHGHPCRIYSALYEIGKRAAARLEPYHLELIDLNSSGHLRILLPIPLGTKVHTVA